MPKLKDLYSTVFNNFEFVLGERGRLKNFIVFSLKSNPYDILQIFFIFTKSIHPMIKIKLSCSEKKTIYTEQQTSNLIQGRFILLIEEGWFFVSRC